MALPAPRWGTALAATVLLLAAAVDAQTCPNRLVQQYGIFEGIPGYGGLASFPEWFASQAPQNFTAIDKCCPSGTPQLDLTFKFDAGPYDVRWRILDVKHPDFPADNSVVIHRDCELPPPAPITVTSATGLYGHPCYDAARDLQSYYYAVGFGSGPADEGPMKPYSIWTERMCLDPGRYELRVGDAYGDGLTFTPSSTDDVRHPTYIRGQFLSGSRSRWQDNQPYYGMSGYSPDITDADILADFDPSNAGLALFPAYSRQFWVFPASFNDRDNSCKAGSCEASQATVQLRYAINGTITAPGGNANDAMSWELKRNGATVSSRTDLGLLGNYEAIEANFFNVPLFVDDMCASGEGHYELVITGPGSVTVKIPGGILTTGLPLVLTPTTTGSGVAQVRTYAFKICPIGDKYNPGTGLCQLAFNFPACVLAGDAVIYAGAPGEFMDRYWPDEKFCETTGEDVVSCSSTTVPAYNQCPGDASNAANICRSPDSVLNVMNGAPAAGYWHHTNGTRSEITIDLTAQKYVSAIRFKHPDGSSADEASKIKAIIVQRSVDGDCGFKNVGAFTRAALPPASAQCQGDQTCDTDPLTAASFTQRIVADPTDGEWDKIELPSALIGQYWSLVFITAGKTDFKLESIDIVSSCAL